jgi:DNA repair protein RadD
MLRGYQQNAVDYAIKWLEYKDTPAIISMATGGGKSHVIAALAEHYYLRQKRVAILAHRKELLVQNGGKLTIPHGYCSASLGDSDLHLPVIVGGIQTIVRRQFQPFDVILVDECHRMPNNTEISQYWDFINRNAGAKLAGLSATPYRMNGGKLAWGEIVYEADYNLLLKGGFVAPLTNKVKHQPDLADIKVTAGDYNLDELSHYMEDPALIDSAVKHIVGYGDGRNSILIFCVSIAHANLLNAAMKANGLSCAVISGDTPSGERERVLRAFRDGSLKHLINCEILLEGFDAPNIDMIVCLRPTKSKSLWVQMLGRGVRLHAAKENCLVIDMAGNLQEHGGIGTPYFAPSKRESKQPKGRICPSCEEFCEPRAKDCGSCGYVFEVIDPPKASHNHKADTKNNAISNPPQRIMVTSVTYAHHISRKTNNKSIKVMYHSPEVKYGYVAEYLSCWHTNEWARGKAHQWFKERGKDIYGGIEQYSAEDLLHYANGELKKPTAIWVDYSGEFPRIKSYEWAEKQNRGGDSAGIGEVLDGDYIAF